ncbi:hypothetical protein Droror1_Dr00000070 [Drosera rotundifolia]
MVFRNASARILPIVLHGCTSNLFVSAMINSIITFLSHKPQPNPPTAIIRDTPTSLESQRKPRHHLRNPSRNPDIIRLESLFNLFPDIIRESQRRQCANVAIVDEIIALALILVTAAVTSSASPTTSAVAKTLPTKTTQRGLNKPKCIKCGNVA